MNHSSKLRLPSFIGVGPARTGTSWLDAALREVAGLPYGIKETHFFDWRYYKGIDWYSYHFRHSPNDVPLGEICPYFPFSEAIERIHTHIPACKIICTFRDPVDRAYSFYKLMRCIALTRERFGKAIEVEPAITEANRYAHHLQLWRREFGEARVLVTLYDDLVEDPQGYLDRICDFIGVKRVAVTERNFGSQALNRAERAPRSYLLAWASFQLIRALESRQLYRIVKFLHHVGVWEYCFGEGERYPPLDADLAAGLRARFLPEIKELEETIGRDLSAWKDPNMSRRKTKCQR